MNKFIYTILATLLLSLLLFSQQETNIKLIIHNKSGKSLDSIIIHDLFDHEKVLYNINMDTIIVMNYNNKEKIPKGERGVFSLAVFDKRYFYTMSNGFIGFPTARLEDEYSFYIYDTYITTKEDFIPKNKDHRHKIEDFKR
ncbi:hypothetical protein [Flavobacterium rhizosphaerae]|uniref:Uncharacterized protein n=1 Tax=Flavobacterium rhizosphaerae TaxID=3163298 RepID=A0ABW8YUS8_9FLAO